MKTILSRQTRPHHQVITGFIGFLMVYSQAGPLSMPGYLPSSPFAATGGLPFMASPFAFPTATTSSASTDTDTADATDTDGENPGNYAGVK